MKKKPKPDPLDRSGLLARATALLGRRDYSRQELFRKLAPLADTEETLIHVLDELAEFGWQSDARFTEQLVRSAVRRGHGPLRARRDLNQKGVHQSLSETALAETDQDEWRRAAKAEASKKLRLLGKPFPEAYPRLYRFLMYRGYTPDTIQSVLDDLKSEIAED